MNTMSIKCQNLHQWMLKNLLEQQIDTDLNFIIYEPSKSKQVIKAHQQILAPFSSLIRNHIEGCKCPCSNSISNNLDIILKDSTRKEIVILMLQLAYYGHVNVEEGEKSELVRLLRDFRVVNVLDDDDVDVGGQNNMETEHNGLIEIMRNYEEEEEEDVENFLHDEFVDDVNIYEFNIKDEDDLDDDNNEIYDLEDDECMIEIDDEGDEEELDQTLDEGDDEMENEEDKDYEYNENEDNEDDDEIFQSSSAVKSTVDAEMKTAKAKCSRCNAQFRGSNNLALHLAHHLKEDISKELHDRTNKTVNELSSCPICHKVFTGSGIDELNRLCHLMLMHDFGQEFMDDFERNLMQTMKITRESQNNRKQMPKKFQCQICSKRLDSFQGIHHHIIAHYRKEIVKVVEQRTGMKVEEMHKCCFDKCNKVLSKDPLLHFVKKHSICQDQMSSRERRFFQNTTINPKQPKSSLDDHNKSISKSSRKCTRCEKSFSGGGLIFHLINHMKEELIELIIRTKNINPYEMMECFECKATLKNNGTDLGVQSCLRHLVCRHKFGFPLMNPEEKALFGRIRTRSPIRMESRERMIIKGCQKFHCTHCQEEVGQNAIHHLAKHLFGDVRAMIEKEGHCQLGNLQTCFICNHSFDTKGPLLHKRVVHFMEKHDFGRPLLSKEEENAIFNKSAKNNMNAHNKSKSANKKWQCRHCDKIVSNRLQQMSHLVQHLRPFVQPEIEKICKCKVKNLQKCFICKEFFSDKGPILHNRVRHFMQRHGFGKDRMTEEEVDMFFNKTGTGSNSGSSLEEGLIETGNELRVSVTRLSRLTENGENDENSTSNDDDRNGNSRSQLSILEYFSLGDDE